MTTEQIKCNICGGPKDGKDRYRCKKCLLEKSRKDNNKRLNFLSEIKLTKGCYKCGFKYHHSALVFHHINSNDKKYEIQRFRRGAGWSWFKEEVKKCIILCTNCHQMYHAGVFDLDINLKDYWSDYEEVVLVTGKKHGIYR